MVVTMYARQMTLAVPLAWVRLTLYTDIFLAFLRSFALPISLGGAVAGFTSSGSFTSDLHERDLAARAPLYRRLYVTLFSHLAVIHLTFFLACSVGVALTLARALVYDSSRSLPSAYAIGPLESSHARLIYLLTRIGWPPLFWLQTVVSALTPLLYILVPPTVPDREQLLDRHPKTGVAYPKAGARVIQRTAAGGYRYVRAFLAIVYTGLLIIGSSWL